VLGGQLPGTAPSSGDSQAAPLDPSRRRAAQAARGSTGNRGIMTLDELAEKLAEMHSIGNGNWRAVAEHSIALLNDSVLRSENMSLALVSQGETIRLLRIDLDAYMRAEGDARRGGGHDDA
jgi:hypothetical protein